MRAKYGLGIWLCAAAALVGVHPTADAQVVDSRWSQPYRLSLPGAPVADRGRIVADSQGNFHVIWAERAAPQQVTILYARFDGESWSAPVAVHRNKANTRLGPQCFTIDRQDNLHLVWTESETAFVAGTWPAVSPLLYSRVRAADALAASAWSAPKTIEATAVMSALAIDGSGVLHLVYTDEFSNTPGIYCKRSTDNGASWSSQPARISPAGTANVPHFARIQADEYGVLHVLWEQRPKDGWQIGQILYTRSQDGGRNWLPVTVLDSVSNDPSEIQYGDPLLALQGRTVYTLWSGGGMANVGRRYRISTDGGQNWTDKAQAFGNLHGFVTGEALIPDPDGRRIHLMDLLRFPQALYHATWDSDRWLDPEAVYLIQKDPSDTIGDRIHAHQIGLALAGRQSVTTFTNATDENPVVLYAMHTLLGEFASVSCASYAKAQPLAPEMIVSGFAPDLARETALASSLPLPVTLGELSVEIVDSTGMLRRAPLFYVSKGQINYMVPTGTALGPAKVRVRTARGKVAVGIADIRNVAPGLFSANAQGAGVAAASFVSVAADGSRTEGLVYVPATLAPVPLDVKAGSLYLALFGTGFRNYQGEVLVTVGGERVGVLAAVPQGQYEGLDQLNIGPLPASLAGKGTVEIRVTVDGRPANAVTVTFK